MERPIILKAHEVRGILDGRQTQLRRIIKPQPNICASEVIQMGDEFQFGFYEYIGNERFGEMTDGLLCSFGKAGDLLWGRETFYEDKDEYDYTLSSEFPYYKGDGFIYRADIGSNNEYYPLGGWVPSSSAPRWSSRILLEIVSVRVERLQDISEADAIANCPDAIEDSNGNTGDYRYSMFCLWDKMFGKKSTDENPWVWVIEFKRVDNE